jgi:hypothetical protein
MRTKKEIEAEAYRRASRDMVAGGWGEYPVGIIGPISEEQYWEEFGEAYEGATLDLEAENETGN